MPGILLDGRCGNLAAQPARRQAAGAERVRQCGGRCRCSLKSAASIYFKLIPATGNEARDDFSTFPDLLLWGSSSSHHEVDGERSGASPRRRQRRGGKFAARRSVWLYEISLAVRMGMAQTHDGRGALRQGGHVSHLWKEGTKARRLVYTAY